MFLHQKLDYNLKFVTEEDIPTIIGDFYSGDYDIIGFDTETTGLNLITDKPFLLAFGFGKNVYVSDMSEAMINTLFDLSKNTRRLFAHNIKFDLHMLMNYGVKIPEDIRLADSMSVARLTEFADVKTSLSLEALGTEYVDSNAKFGGRVIKDRIIELNRTRKSELKTKFIEKFGKTIPFGKVWEAYQGRVQFIEDEYDEYFLFIDENYSESTYQDVYIENKGLMINYAADDIVIMLEYLKQSLPTLMQTDPSLVTFNRESDLIMPIVEMEKIGFRADVPYLLDSRKRLIEYRDALYKELHEITVSELSVGQHKELAKVFESRFGIVMFKTDESALEDILNLENVDDKAKEMARLIIELRTVDKWLSTYIDGKLNSVVNGRLYTSINNQGAVSGRVSSNLQQQPKEPLLSRAGEELFHPRKVFLADEDHYLFFLDFSQMELRFQAYYTMLMGNGDKNMCRAYIPFDCESFITGEKFNPKDKEILSRWDSTEWLDEKGNIWEPIDLHAVTTFIAFPHLNEDTTHPEFKKLRKLGKMCNFLKNYQGGEQAIIEQMKVDPETAKVLDQAYYQAFPEIKSYQQWVVKELTVHGFVENLYGRRYYMQDSRWFYKAGNYVIQGGCADLVKQKEIEVSRFLKDYKTRFVLPIHDELVFSVPKDEVHLVEKLQHILQDTEDVLKWIPMVSEIEYTSTNWAEKELWENTKTENYIF